MMMKRSQNLLHVADDELKPLAVQLPHQMTMLSDKVHGAPGRLGGITIWSNQNRSATVYWTWSINDEGYPVLADPLAIRSNLLFRDDGEAPSFEDQVIGINQLVYSLPWQHEVTAYLARLGLPGAQIPTARPRRAKRAGESAAPQSSAMLAAA